MINPERIKALCHPEVFKRVPVVEGLQIQHGRIGESNILSARGGCTIVRIVIKGKRFVGSADCSKSDNFCKKTGRELAFKRAIRQYWDYEKCKK